MSVWVYISAVCVYKGAVTVILSANQWSAFSKISTQGSKLSTSKTLKCT